MPELPEVETIRRCLEPLLVGRRVVGVRVRRPDVVGHPTSARSFRRGVRGRTVHAVGRRGKYLVLEFDGGRELVTHLRLSGHLAVVERRSVPRHERIRYVLSDGKVLSFIEPRALGRAYLVERGRYPRALRGMVSMGPEPIAPGFNVRWLASQLRGRRAPVKALLLDQRVCCGVGNIYADEALHRAGVKPARPAHGLKPAEVSRLADKLREVLRDGIRWCGTTLGDGRYLRPDGRAGSFQHRLAVVGRAGDGCRRCGGIVRRTRVAGRGTYYCPGCQK